jgi:putative sigma-54 modulation protein
MISNIQITASKMELDRSLKSYINKKIANLDRFLPRHARESVHAEVVLREVNRAHGNKYEGEVILHLPDNIITVKDSTLNAFAVIDILEQKMKNRLAKYKDKHVPAARSRQHGLFRRLRSRVLGFESV